MLGNYCTLPLILHKIVAVSHVDSQTLLQANKVGTKSRAAGWPHLQLLWQAIHRVVANRDASGPSKACADRLVSAFACRIECSTSF